MRKILWVGISVLFFFVLSCGENNKKAKPDNYEVKIQKEKIPASKVVDLKNKGVGPVSKLTLDNKIDSQLAAQGSEIFNKMCTACHKIGKKFIGPDPSGIMERRSPEWIMNMILDPEGMVKNDPLAKQLLIEFNGSPMANQSLSEDEARAVLEYLRTLN